MNDKLAIDIALLPPDEIRDKANEINRTHGPEFLLNKTDRLPHLTLSQAILNRKDLKEAMARLSSIASRFKPLQLKAKLVPNFIEPYENEELNNLHETVMKEFENLVSYDVEEEHFFEQPIRKQSLNYVRNFRNNAAHGNYYPHLTLGITKPVGNMPDIRFTIKRLAICHLGNYNTCRKILAEASLGES